MYTGLALEELTFLKKNMTFSQQKVWNFIIPQQINDCSQQSASPVWPIVMENYLNMMNIMQFYLNSMV